MSIKFGNPSFSERVNHGLQDSFMRGAVSSAQSRLAGARVKAMDELGNWEEWRELAESIRSHTLENLDYYLYELSENVQKRGGHVFFAQTPQEASEYIKSVVQQKEAKKIVKSKSMVTEEIELNKVLENIGCDVIETDLGEYIIQLAEDPPSHFIAPALHKNRDQVRDVFKEKRNYQKTSKPEELTLFAREQLRKEFLSADVGITGCNFAVADTGTVTLVTNEGNARMVTSMPKTQISVMGMERIVPSWQELDVMVSMLTRSAVGQTISTYVTATTGPREQPDIDGPEDFHLVIVDNGRSNIIGTEFQSALHCIRCAACINVCPVYRHIGGHAYGSIYSGPIGAVLSPLFEGYDNFKELPYASTLCSACTDACPVKIPLHELLQKHRQKIVEDEGKSPVSEKLAMKAFRMATQSSSIYNMGTKSASNLTKIFEKDGRISKGPGPLKEWTSIREFPAANKERFRDWFKNQRKSGDSE